MLRLTAVFLMLFSHAAIGKPVYLNCGLNMEDDSKPIQILLNEDSGKITHTGKGVSFTTDAFFTADKVSYQSKRRINSNVVMTSVYTIDRVSLSYEMVMSGNQSAKTATMTGGCELRPVPERAF